MGEKRVATTVPWDSVPLPDSDDADGVPETRKKPVVVKSGGWVGRNRAFKNVIGWRRQTEFRTVVKRLRLYIIRETKPTSGRAHDGLAAGT